LDILAGTRRWPRSGPTGTAKFSSGTKTISAPSSKRLSTRHESSCCFLPARVKHPAGARFFKPLRQIIESINDTLKGQLDLEQHGGRTSARVIARVLQRLLAMTAAIWHNDRMGEAVWWSLTAYGH
jgi:hypothetical protein